MNDTPWNGAAARATAADFAAAGTKIGCEVAVIHALWAVEASGRGFRNDGSLARRFEPHKMPGSTMTWRDSLKISEAQREQMFQEAYAQAPDAALTATSWGGSQILGENYAAAGFASVRDMVLAMAASEAAHLTATVTLCIAWGIDGALRARDWAAFAKRWNGEGQPEIYAAKLESAYRAVGGVASPVVLKTGARGATVKQLQLALGVENDGKFGPETLTAVQKFQTANGLKADGVVGAKTWAAIKAVRPMLAAPPPQHDAIDLATAKLTKVSALIGGASAMAGQVKTLLPGGAYELLAYGAVGIMVFSAAAAGFYLIRRRLA